MKKKLKSLGRYLMSWEFAIHMNLFFAACFVLCMIFAFDMICVNGTLYHSSLAVMSYIALQYEKQHQSDIANLAMAHDLYVHAHNRVVIYKRHYGDLTPEMEKELTEGEKAAAEESEKKNSAKKEKQS